MTPRSTLAVLAALLGAAPALAQTAPEPAPVIPPAFRGAGGGHGGWNQPQTLQAYQARQRERVMRADTDGDGRISLAEWMTAHPPRPDEEGGPLRHDPSREFARLDANHDGYVTPAEVDAASAARFARMDLNHDGVLTPDERRAMWRGGGEHGGPPPD